VNYLASLKALDGRLRTIIDGFGGMALVASFRRNFPAKPTEGFCMLGEIIVATGTAVQDLQNRR
jgi:hypothetical protein